MNKFPLFGRAEWREGGTVSRVTPWRFVGFYSSKTEGHRSRAFGYAERKVRKLYPDCFGVEITSRNPF